MFYLRLFRFGFTHFSSAALKLMKSYIYERLQLVKIGDVKSDLQPIISGVPQGSILGPLLFLIYINDISSCIDISSSIDLYADDSTLHTSGRDIQSVQSDLQSCLDRINYWCKINNMSINPVKTKCMLISSKHRLKRQSTLSLEIDSHYIDNVSSQKVMGIHVENCLQWNVHIRDVCNKLAIKINLLKRLTPFLNTDMKNLFYNAYIIPQFDYCCIVWANGTKSSLNKVFSLQKRAARTILMKPNLTPSLPLFNSLKWLTFENRYKYHTGVLVFKALNNQAPTYISDVLKTVSSHNYHLRSTTRGDIISKAKVPNTKNVLNSFSNKGKELWNCLPIEIRHSKSLYNFKTLLKKYLFQKQISSCDTA